MKYVVSRKGVLAFLPVSILYNIVSLVAIVLTTLDSQEEAKYVRFIFIIVLFLLNITLFFLYKTVGSSVTFENDRVRCSFLKITIKSISYNDIKYYGVFWEKGIKFIYISKMELSQFQKDEKMFELYKKTKDVIVVQYHDDIMEHLCKMGKELVNTETNS
ncbi:MAG: hypothetical protein BGN88_12370 [Clostridiales bacterium 43-6]|nr:MAG: hypothetical protein BGN88_12370 [Clostridiales bacterium 43-6]